MLLTLPDICTPAQVAEALQWNKAGVLKAVRDGKMAGIKISENRVRIAKADVIKFVEERRCPAKTQAPPLNGEQTEAALKSSNTLPESVSDEQLIYAACRRQRRNALNSSPAVRLQALSRQ